MSNKATIQELEDRLRELLELAEKLHEGNKRIPTERAEAMEKKLDRVGMILKHLAMFWNERED